MIDYDNSSSQAGTGSPQTSLTWNHTVGGTDTLLLVAIELGGGNTPTSVKYNSVNMTEIAASAVSSVQCGRISFWYLANPTTGNNAILAAFPSDNAAGLAISLKGARQTSISDATATNTSSGASDFSATVTANSNKCWTVAAFVSNQFTTISARNTTTMRQSLTGSSGKAACAIVDGGFYLAPIISKTLEVTATAGFWIASIVTLAPSSSSPVKPGNVLRPRIFKPGLAR